MSHTETMPGTGDAQPAAVPAPACFHCGLPVPAGVHFSARVDGAAQAMCCAGCAAVAQAIADNGLADYYRHRDALPQRPDGAALPDVLAGLRLFDSPGVQKNFVRAGIGELAEHEREVSLILEGITCSACIWLNETHLARQPGVLAVEINFATRRARVRWDSRRMQLSDILQAVEAIGYHAHPFDVRRAEALAQSERKAALWRLFVAGFGMMQVMMYALPAYLAEIGGDMRVDIARLLQWASLILTTPVVLYSAAPFFRHAWRDLRNRRVGMDVPVAIGVGSAYAASLWATLRGSGEVYYDSVTMFVFLLLAGRYFELMARQRAARGIEAISLGMPVLALRFAHWPEGLPAAVAAAELRVDDVVLVKPGESVPADGVVIDGVSEVDESLLTGESLPRARGVGDALVGGSVNRGSPLVMRVAAVGEATRMATIARLMERASAEKPQLVVLADRVAAWFVVVLLLLACATALLWWQVDPQRTLGVFVAVLVVSCPCALSLATPTALSVATGALAARGLLVTRGHAIETLARAQCMVFDKTGTLTEGRFALRAVLPLGSDEATARRIAAALEQRAEHPLARILQDAAGASVLPTVSHWHAVCGAGIEGQIDGQRWRIGSLAFAGALHGQPLPDPALAWMAAHPDAAATRVALSSAAGWGALFLLADTLRADAAQSVAALHTLGLHTQILSGDSARAVQQVAHAVGITQFRADCSPEQKHALLSALQAQGQVVAMVGDGVNDAPVLAQAHVSLAMAGGADLTRAHADVVLLGEALAALPQGVALARRTLRIVRQNLTWAALYNAVALPLAMSGLVTPWMAGIGMSASSLLVVLNALRLQAPGRKEAS